MKIIITSLLALFLWSPPKDHDSIVAFFNLSQEENGAYLNVIFDIQDYLDANHISSSEVSREQFKHYLDSVTSWTINDAESSIEVLDIKVEGEHFNANCKLSSEDKKIYKLKIHNEFLLPKEEHSNIIMIDANDSYRDFRMHAGRKEIEITYKQPKE